ncbi:TetR/AcrR family transcriptional regulator [Pseudomonas sp. EA_105y_Pfl2_R69]|uniref:TetR/AcrR family transcriptional regulator n=1 Tax=Pseudomonas sp. EA_105y_Pfl2_R69 TaxID=3088683 RepID=UPI0030DD2768
MIRRGRFRRFDPDWAAHQAMLEFWRYGYAGATLTRLKSAMGGICSPSLYAAFGSKERLFRRALDIYLREELLPSRQLLQDGGLHAVRRFFRQVVLRYTADGKPRGCLVESCLAERELNGTSTERLLAEQRAETLQALLACLDRGLLGGELSTAVDPLRLARLLSLFLPVLSSQAREGAPREELMALVEDLLACVLPPGKLRHVGVATRHTCSPFLRPNLSSANINVFQPAPPRASLREGGRSRATL